MGLILFQDTVNATMMKLFKIWCSRCHTECIDIYSAITSFPIFLPNQPMLMLQCVCRIPFGWGWGDWKGLCKSFAFLFSLGIEKGEAMPGILYASDLKILASTIVGSQEMGFLCELNQNRSQGSS